MEERRRAAWAQPPGGIVDRSRSAGSGSIVLDHSGSEFTIETSRLEAGCFLLEAANPDFPGMVIVEASAFGVKGVVTGVNRTS